MNSWIFDLKVLARLLFGAALGFAMTGCVVAPPEKPGDPYYAPVLSPTARPETPQNGSLYSGQSILLFDDRKAMEIGDIITITLQERTTSQKTANIEVVKESDVGVNGDSTFMGSRPSLGGLGLGTSLISDREFKGGSKADQGNQLTGSISVTVTNVFPNGTLEVRGEKWITLNRGGEYIRVSGLVRPDDVSPDNTVVSTKVANARITYSGSGEFAESTQMGWLSRFFNSPLWPF